MYIFISDGFQLHSGSRRGGGGTFWQKRYPEILRLLFQNIGIIPRTIKFNCKHYVHTENSKIRTHVYVSHYIKCYSFYCNKRMIKHIIQKENG